MAHGILEQVGGFPYASRARFGHAWHELGSVVADDASIDEFFRAAGYDYSYQRKVLAYQADGLASLLDAQAIVHSKTMQCVGTCSGRMQFHQPAQIAKFFGEIFFQLGLTVDSAGVLFGGKIMFASAKLGDVSIVGSDKITLNLLIVSPADGSGATKCYLVQTRVVCNNTLCAALAEAASGMKVSASHRAELDPIELASRVVLDMARLKTEAETYKQLAQSGVTLEAAKDIVAVLLSAKRGTDLTVEKDPNARTRKVRNGTPYKTILKLFDGAGQGAALPGVKNTLWGLHNAITEYTTHHATSQTASHRFMANLKGQGQALADASAKFMQLVAHQDPDTMALLEQAPELIA